MAVSQQIYLIHSLDTLQHSLFLILLSFQLPFSSIL